jgi:hypothetical protein
MLDWRASSERERRWPRRLNLDERCYWVLLSMVPQIGPSRFRRLLDVFGDPRAIWMAKAVPLAQAGLDRRAIEGIQQLRDQLDPTEVWQRLERLGVAIVTWADPAYPEHLREIADSPPILYLKGDLLSTDRWAVAVVGTRRVTPYGRQVVERLVAELSRSGVTIVSGLARGIDALAHRVALQAGGRTLAVLGSGLDRLYPTEHAALAREITAKGAVITELPLGPTYPRTGLASAPSPCEAGEFPLLDAQPTHLVYPLRIVARHHRGQRSLWTMKSSPPARAHSTSWRPPKWRSIAAPRRASVFRPMSSVSASSALCCNHTLPTAAAGSAVDRKPVFTGLRHLGLKTPQLRYSRHLGRPWPR